MNERGKKLGAEIGSSLICADLGIVPELEPRPDHAAYLASWLEVLSNDKRAIFSAAAHAQRAAAYVVLRSIARIATALVRKRMAIRDDSVFG